MTVVREDVTSKTEVAFTRNLVWEPVPVSGRRVRITQEDADRFEEIQARRVFGDAEVGYFAVVNPLYPDAGNPSVIAREWTGGEGVHHSECYGPDRKWVSTETITYVRNRYHDGMLEPVTEETAARLIEAWTPRPRDVRCFACLTRQGSTTTRTGSGRTRSSPASDCSPASRGALNSPQRLPEKVSREAFVVVVQPDQAAAVIMLPVQLHPD